MSNKEELLKKIKALADSGVGGEKENAQKLLAELMERYGISEETLCEEVIKEFEINIPKGFKAHELAVQVFYSIVGHINDKKYFSAYKHNHKRYIFCTASEFVEFEAKYKFYLHHLRKEAEIFYGAFVNKNSIFPPPEIDEKRPDKFFLTEEEVKTINMARSLEKHNYNLQIEGDLKENKWN